MEGHLYRRRRDIRYFGAQPKDTTSTIFNKTPARAFCKGPQLPDMAELFLVSEPDSRQKIFFVLG